MEIFLADWILEMGFCLLKFVLIICVEMCVNLFLGLIYTSSSSNPQSSMNEQEEYTLVVLTPPKGRGLCPW
ncbi:hypothetical protein L1887_05788 [Cichorium endivia]|nr:hypothetical protein L1887_05788 [Cichorium endivia]